MKHLKPYIVVLLVLISIFSFAQNKKEKASEFYNKGVKMFKNKRYNEAESWFNKSIELFPHKDTYYNLAMTKLIMGDTCEYCKNLMSGAHLNDTEAIDLFVKKCLADLRVDFDNHSHKDSSFYGIFTIYPCQKKILVREYHIKNLKTNALSTYKINDTDSTYYNEKSFPGVFPAYNNFIEEKTTEVDSLTIYTVVENMPKYPGGDDARIKFLGENIKYPQKDKENGIQGTVYVTFIIETDGSVSNVGVLRGIGGGCDEEAIRVVRIMPKWNPGTQSGKAVRVQYNMPIKFTLAIGHY
jgi:TonB family protein